MKGSKERKKSIYNETVIAVGELRGASRRTITQKISLPAEQLKALKARGHNLGTLVRRLIDDYFYETKNNIDKVRNFSALKRARDVLANINKHCIDAKIFDAIKSPEQNVEALKDAYLKAKAAASNSNAQKRKLLELLSEHPGRDYVFVVKNKYDQWLDNRSKKK